MNRKELSNALDIVNKCSVENRLIPIFSHIRFDKVSIQSFNGVQGISVPFDSGLEFTVKSDLFTNLVDSFSSELVDIAKSTDSYVTLKQGKSTNKISILDNTNFISPFPTVRGNKNITVDESFIEGMKKCLVTSNKDNIKESQNGVTLKNSKSGFFIYSTDGSRVSRFKINDGSDDTFEFLLPERFCRLLVGLYTSGDITLEITTDYVIASLKDCEIYTSINTSLKLENCEGVLTKYNIDSLSYEDIPTLFRESVSRGNIVLKDSKTKKVSLSLDPKKVKLEVFSSQAELEEEIDLPTPLTATFNVDIDLLSGTLSTIKNITFLKVAKGYIIAGSDDNFVTMLGAA